MLICPAGLNIYNYYQYRYKNSYIYSIYPFIPQSVLMRIYTYIINDTNLTHEWEIYEFDDYPNHYIIIFDGKDTEIEKYILKHLLLEYRD